MEGTKHGRRAAIAILMVLGLLAAACGDDDAGTGSDDSEPSSSDDAAPVQGIDGNTIRIAGLVDQATQQGADDGFRARIERANADGELGDYTIDYIGSSDPGATVDQALSQAQDYVERDEVFALAPVLTTGFDESVASFVADSGVPTWGGGFNPAYCAPNDSHFSILGCYIGPEYGYTTPMEGVATALDKEPGDLTWAIMALATPDGEQLTDDYTTLIEAIGGEVVYAEAVIPQSAGGDLQPFVSAVMDEEPDVIWLLAASQALGLTGALNAAGYDGSIVNSAFYGPGMLETPGLAAALEGSIVTTLTPVIESDSPVVQQMLADYEAAGLAQDSITFGGMFGWWIGDLLVSMLQEVAPNFGDVVTTVGDGFTYDMAEGGNPLVWPEAFHETVKCATVLTVEGGAYEIVAPQSCDGERIQLR
jgi:ABC-type branched-subunit amino acid transport system substrate-binding protein